MRTAGHWHIGLAADSASSAAPGMAYVRRTLDAMPHEGADAARQKGDVLLVACELLANACRHTPGPTDLDIDLDGDRLTVAVTDSSATLPEPRPWCPAAPNGHGLHIVERLTTGWGTVPAGSGKTVWACLPWT
ncbi:ATP-binding protein [Kitasatospora terrestris]|uniref:ATP-binding protein n=1 Tax=Kitasatospora terrestris TaxID=258051 RepID=A0ABP9D9K2_9ACTN